MKLKTVYACQSCGYQTGKWLGRCPSCNEWNTFAEDVINVGKADTIGGASGASAVRHTRLGPLEKPQKIALSAPTQERIKTGLIELDTVLGGGIAESSLILLSGEPGIGKSTLTLQIVDLIAAQNRSVLYITGEEAISQIADRARRLGLTQTNISLLYETCVENILTAVANEKPHFLVVDSIQVLSSQEIAGSAGSISQVRFATELLMNEIKSRKIPLLLIGHVNKEGSIAGPKVLEHLVDTVLILEGERDHELRLLRVLKNRFGPVNEVGLFEMTATGMRELKNPGERILDMQPRGAVGSALTITMEGNRPLLMEVQALTNRTNFGYPKRMAEGFDRNRLELLAAVISRHTSFDLQSMDIYVNITGGLSLSDPAGDSAVCAAIISSVTGRPLPAGAVFFGEVGLTGEIRPSFKDPARLKAAEKMGLKRCGNVKRLEEMMK
ncbi:MAG: DNA repair protein RadA [Candidatus Gracilibacteria bacterium]|jgi:DNA repair protein RadA/Sms